MYVLLLLALPFAIEDVTARNYEKLNVINITILIKIKSVVK